MKQIIIILMVVVGITSCKKSVIQQPVEPGEVLIAVKSSNIDNANLITSRAKSIDGFDATSQIGIYTTLTPSKDLSQARDMNIGYSNPLGSTYWDANDKTKGIYYAQDDGQLNFFAYHPYTAQPNSTVTLVGLSVAPTLAYTLPTTQSDANVLVVADLMWGNENEVKESDGAVKIEFNHMLTKVSINLKKGSDWGAEEAQLSAIKMYGNAIRTKANLDLSSGKLVSTPVEVGASNAIECILAPKEEIGISNAKTYDFIVLPVDDIEGLTLEFVINGTSYKTVLGVANIPDPANRTFRASTNRVFGITINRYDPNQFNVVPSIVGWNVVNEIDVEGI